MCVWEYFINQLEARRNGAPSTRLRSAYVMANTFFLPTDCKVLHLRAGGHLIGAVDHSGARAGASSTIHGDD